MPLPKALTSETGILFLMIGITNIVQIFIIIELYCGDLGAPQTLSVSIRFPLTILFIKSIGLDL